MRWSLHEYLSRRFSMWEEGGDFQDGADGNEKRVTEQSVNLLIRVGRIRFVARQPAFLSTLYVGGRHDCGHQRLFSFKFNLGICDRFERGPCWLDNVNFCLAFERILARPVGIYFCFLSSR